MRAANLKWFDVMKLNVPRYGQLLLAIIHHGWLTEEVGRCSRGRGEGEGGRSSHSSCKLRVGSNRIASHWIGSDRFGYAMLARHATSAYSVLFLWPQLFQLTSPTPYTLCFNLFFTPFAAPFFSFFIRALSMQSIKPNSVKR